MNELKEIQEKITSLETQQKKFTFTSSESASKEILVYQADKNKVQLGIPTPWGIVGPLWEKDQSRLVISEQHLQSQQVIELGQKIIEQQLGIQGTEEQNQQAQIQIPPK